MVSLQFCPFSVATRVPILPEATPVPLLSVAVSADHEHVILNGTIWHICKAKKKKKTVQI